MDVIFESFAPVSERSAWRKNWSLEGGLKRNCSSSKWGGKAGGQGVTWWWVKETCETRLLLLLRAITYRPEEREKAAFQFLKHSEPRDLLDQIQTATAIVQY